MRVRGLKCNLIGTEGASPPLPYIEVEDSEGAELIGRGLAEEVTDVVEPTPAPAKSKAKASEAAPPPPPPPPASEPPAPPVSDGEPREEAIAAALDLVEADHLIKEGPRAGKPDVGAVEEISGLTNVTEAEIDAALAAKESAH